MEGERAAGQLSRQVIFRLQRRKKARTPKASNPSNPVAPQALPPVPPVTGPAAILPNKSVVIVGYQVIVDPFQVTVPANTTQVTLPPEFAASLSRGQHPFEVLAIEASGNQTITEGVFVKP